MYGISTAGSSVLRTIGGSPHGRIRHGGESGVLPREAETGIGRWEGDRRVPVGVPWDVCTPRPVDPAPTMSSSSDVDSTPVDPMTPLGSFRQPLRGPFTRWPRTTDAVLAIVVFMAGLFSGSFQDAVDTQDFTIAVVGDLPNAAYFVLAAGSAALYWRRWRPLVVFGVSVFVSILWAGLGYPGDPGLAVPVSLYSVGRYAIKDRWSYTGAGVALALEGIGSVIRDEPAQAIGLALLLTFLPWYIGRRIRIRGEYVTILQEHAAHLERERTAQARRAVAEERSRIARELHDVVAHRVSMMTVQAGAAKTVAADDPAAALQAMEAVEQAGRQALGELRHLLGVLRLDAEVDGLGPLPGLADVRRLVDQVGQTGLEVSLTSDGLPTDLPARVDLSAYRIVQEALTNVLKHAGPGARAEVRLSTDNHLVAIEVLDTGQGGTILPGSGHGIVGMRERALLLGGTLDAGPRPGGGFQVVARLPVGEEQA